MKNLLNRNKRKTIAQETVGILERGEYRTTAGQFVTLQPGLRNAIDGTLCYSPNDFEKVIQQCHSACASRQELSATRFEVFNTTTFAAAKQLVREDSSRRVVGLNFASAKNPGGGFLGGSQAQEECLARASGLYACIHPQQTYYEANRACNTCLYTDHLIYSPDVPVFRNDEDEFLDEPYSISIITAPAVNAGAVVQNEPANLGKIEAVMLRRMKYLLSIACLHNHDTLVLGAWGCGVFSNDPQQVAKWFHQLLCEQGPFRNVFKRVVFAVLDGTEQKTVLQPFLSTFETEPN